jgi:hypothetical protein
LAAAKGVVSLALAPRGLIQGERDLPKTIRPVIAGSIAVCLAGGSAVASSTDVPLGYRVATLESCSGGGDVSPQVRIAAHGRATVNEHSNGSVTISFEYTAQAVGAGPGVYSIRGTFGVKVVGGGEPEIDGNRFIIDIASGGTFDDIITLNFPASEHVKIMWGTGSGSTTLSSPRIYFLDGTCHAN